MESGNVEPCCWCLLTWGEAAQVGDALVKSLSLLVGCDCLQNIVNHPFDFPLLWDATVNVLTLNLVVQTTLNFVVHSHGTFTINGFELECNVFLLGVEKHHLTFSTPLLFLFGLDVVTVILQLSFTTLVPLFFYFLQYKEHWISPSSVKMSRTYVNFLVQVSSHLWAELLGGEDDHEKDGKTGVVFVLHDVDFLRQQVGHQTSAKDVWTSDTCFRVEQLEPKTRRYFSDAIACCCCLLTIHQEWSPCEPCQGVLRELGARIQKKSQLLGREQQQRVAELKLQEKS